MRIAVTLLSVLLIAGVAGAQEWFQWNRGFRRAPPRFPAADSFDGAFNFCRLMYTSVRREAGGQGWWTDYPDADVNFSIRLSELTKTRVSRQPNGQPNHLVVRAEDDEMFQCPFMIIEDAGTASFSDIEVARLREYLLKGGFLWVDDFWGTAAWEHWSTELARVLPPHQFPIFDLPDDHPLFRTLFEVKEVPQVPAISFWRRSGGATSERGYDSEVVNVRGVNDARGRLMVFMTHNTDIADAWEREGEDPQFFYLFSPNGYAVGVNVLIYAMTR